MTLDLFDREVRCAFDAWAPTYEMEARAKIAARGYSYAALGTAIAASIEPGSGPVLEVGVGPGVLGVEVARAAGTVELHGIDISPGMLDIARSRGVYSRLDLAAADAFDYSETYRLIFSAFAFHSVRDQISFLRRAGSGLSPRAQLVIVDLFPATALPLEATLEHSRRFEKGAPSKYVDDAGFRALAEEAGLTVAEHHLLGERRDFVHGWYTLHAS